MVWTTYSEGILNDVFGDGRATIACTTDGRFCGLEDILIVVNPRILGGAVLLGHLGGAQGVCWCEQDQQESAAGTRKICE